MLGKPPNKYCFLIGQTLVMSLLYEVIINSLRLSFSLCLSFYTYLCAELRIGIFEAWRFVICHINCRQIKNRRFSPVRNMPNYESAVFIANFFTNLEFFQEILYFWYIYTYLRVNFNIHKWKYSRKEHGTWGKRTGNITASILTQTEHMCSKC